MPNWMKRYKDMEKARTIRNKYRKRNYSLTQGFEPRAWTTHEMDMIMTSTLSDRELSVLIKRSVQSIQIKRSRLKQRLNREVQCEANI